MLSREGLEALLDAIMTQEVEYFVSTVPYATHLTDRNQRLHECYYLRHRVETIKRIRMTSKTDALALYYMVEEDYDAARWWSRYTSEELDHDVLYMKDLKEHGYTDELVAKIEPFQSTKDMLGYLTTQIEKNGSLAAVAYSVFVEWNSERFSAKVVKKAEVQYSSMHVSGSKAHVGIDENEDHYQVMLDVVHRLVSKRGDEQVLIHLIHAISKYFCAYFTELYNNTVKHSLMPA